MKIAFEVNFHFKIFSKHFETDKKRTFRIHSCRINIEIEKNNTVISMELIRKKLTANLISILILACHLSVSPDAFLAVRVVRRLPLCSGVEFQIIAQTVFVTYSMQSFVYAIQCTNMHNMSFLIIFQIISRSFCVCAFCVRHGFQTWMQIKSQISRSAVELHVNSSKWHPV